MILILWFYGVVILMKVWNGGGEIVFYVIVWCGYCAKICELFVEDGVVYCEVDIEKDSVGRVRY